jgi:hypothetical protein
MNFIRNFAVKSYRKELIRYENVLAGMNEKQLAKYLIFSVWVRSILQIEGHINPMRWVDSSSSENIDLEPELHIYPFMLKDINNFSKFLNKNKQKTKSFALLLWTYTLKAIIRPELNEEINRIWGMIMKTKPYWKDEIRQMREEDIEIGIEKDFVSKTEQMVKEIIKTLPPKQISI